MELLKRVTHPLVVVTNREPYIDERTRSGIRTIQKAGGVVSALDPLLQSLGGDWVAWGSGTADRDTAPKGTRLVPPKSPRYRLHRVFLSPEEIQGYYTHYANQGLWPLSHLLIERAQFSRDAWPIYRSVNQKFARRVAQQSPPQAWVFSHDYQLALLPQELKKLRPDIAIAHFWHIPWPTFPVFRLCPQYQEIVRGLLGADILGFQTPDDVDNFLTAVERTVKSALVDRDDGDIFWQGRTVRVRAIPISVDVEAIEALVESPRIARWARGIRRRLKASHRYLGVSVDRADYTKGILPRLAAIDAFFDRYPEHRGQVVFLQVVVPTRSEVEAYRKLFREVEQETLRINHRYAYGDWKPVITVRRAVDRARLMGIFRAADFALVSSLFDGMNLVAKEFVSAQVDGRGVLLLSETAGAAVELQEALHVSPLDPEGLAATLHQALTMPISDREARMRRMRQQVHEHTIYDWMAQIFELLQEVSETYARS